MVGKPSIVDLLEHSLQASSVKQKVIANNIANLNTPGFRRGDVEFEKILAEQLDSAAGVDMEELKAQITQPQNTPLNSKGNDVNMEMEVGNMIKSVGRHKVMLKVLKKYYQQMDIAMREKV